MSQSAPGASAPSAVEEDGPLDLHELHLHMNACGYTRDLLLPCHTVQNIAMRLRAVNAVTSMLLSEDEDLLNFGNWMRYGLLEAVSCLASDAAIYLEERNSLQAKGELQ